MSEVKQSATILVDTNVWIDYYLGYRPGSKEACELMETARAKGVAVLYACTSSKDIYYTVRGDTKRKVRLENGSLTESEANACNELAWGCIRNMTDNAIAANVGQAEMWLACHHKKLHSDFEDDLVIAAAQSAEADYFVTNDQALLGKCPVTAFTPQGMVDYLKC